MATPFGLNLALMPAYPVADSINKFLSIDFGGIVTYNLDILVSYILTAIFMYLLVYKLTSNKLSSFFASVIFTFCPYHIARTWQHPGLAQIQWFPLYILSLCNLRERATKKNIIFCAVSFSLAALFNYYYAYFAFIAMLAFAVFVLASDKKSSLKAIRAIFISLLAAFLLLSPIILPIIKKALFAPKTENLVAGGYLRQFSNLFEQSAKPLSYFLPATVHPVFGKFTENFVGTRFYGMSLTEHTLYLGWVPLLLALYTIRIWRKNKKLRITNYGLRITKQDNFYIGFFIFLAIVAWFFSQPPWWQIGALKIYMPSFFMYKILPMFRAYCRFGVIVMLAVSVLAGFGIKFILGRFKNQKIRIVVTSLFCGLVLFEFWNWPPYKVIDVSGVPAVYYWLKRQPGTFIIAEYPLDADSPNEMYRFYQTVHEKKIINGTIPGTYANKVAQVIRKLSQPQTTGILKWMGVEYVLVHRQGYTSTGLVDDSEELNKIPEKPGLKLIKSFSSQECRRKDIMCVQKSGPIDVYEVTASPIEPEVK